MSVCVCTNNFKGKLEVRIVFTFRHLVVMVKVRVKCLRMNYVNECPHKAIKTNIGVCHLVHRWQISSPVLELLLRRCVFQSQSFFQISLVRGAGVKKVEPTGHSVSSPVRDACRMDGGQSVGTQMHMRDSQILSFPIMCCRHFLCDCVFCILLLVQTFCKISNNCNK